MQFQVQLIKEDLTEKVTYEQNLKAEGATMKTSEGRQFQAEDPARAGGGSGLKMEELSSNGRKNQTSRKQKLRLPP